MITAEFPSSPLEQVSTPEHVRIKLGAEAIIKMRQFEVEGLES